MKKTEIKIQKKLQKNKKPKKIIQKLKIQKKYLVLSI